MQYQKVYHVASRHRSLHLFCPVGRKEGVEERESEGKKRRKGKSKIREKPLQIYVDANKCMGEPKKIRGSGIHEDAEVPTKCMSILRLLSQRWEHATRL